LQAGKVSSLDEIVTEFLSAKPEERSNILKKAEEEASKLEGAAAGYVWCSKHASCVQDLLFTNIHKQKYNLQLPIDLPSIYGTVNLRWASKCSAFPFASPPDRIWLNDRYGKVYLKVLKSIIEKGDGYVKKEADRLSRLLSGSVNPNKVDEFTVKKNILLTILDSDS
jgi:hypothetical protein